MGRAGQMDGPESQEQTVSLDDKVQPDLGKSAEKEMAAAARDQMVRTVQKEMEIFDDDLKYLADQRALAVKGAILADGTIGSKRIFIVETNALAPEDRDKAMDVCIAVMKLK